MIGLAIESATAHVEVLITGADGAPLALRVEDVGHGHTRRLVPMIGEALAEAGLAARDLAWIAADLGPGSFTGVRVGLATAAALALAAGAPLLGASSLAALALASGARRALVVPLVPAGRRDVYAGFFRADARGAVTLLAAPRVGTPEEVREAVVEAQALLGGWPPYFVGPGAARERETLEHAWPGSAPPTPVDAGLSAHALAAAARSGRGPRAGLPVRGTAVQPLYVRPAQAEERVRRRVTGAEPILIRPFAPRDVPEVTALEARVFADAWPASFFRGELGQSLAYATIAERDGALAGYLVSWLGAGTGHLGNLAVAPEMRRRGVARALLDDFLTRARERGIDRVTLEVRVSNFDAQALYRTHGFRLAGLRRGYYRDSGEDALIMEWRESGGD